MLIAPAAVLSHAAPAASPSETPMLRIVSRALGELDVSPTLVMHFPVPIGGFPLYRDYALLPAAREGLWWLQSIEDPEATFILADPFLHDSDYGFDIGDAERDALRIVDEADAFGLVMITLPNADSDRATANCRAPLVFNLRQQLAMQVISRDDRHEVRRPIDLARYEPHAHGVRMQ
jgi:flagellar assembly factor FliW